MIRLLRKCISLIVLLGGKIMEAILKMLKKIIITGMVVILISCSNNSSLNVNNEDATNWIQNTTNLIENSYESINGVGGFSNNPIAQRMQKNAIDLNSSIWYLKTLELLGTSEINKFDKEKIKKQLINLFEEPPTTYSKIYTYWTILSIFNLLDIPYTNEMKNIATKYMEENTNEMGFFEKSDGGMSSLNQTIIEIRLKKELGLRHSINSDHLLDQVKIKNKELLTYLVLCYESDTKLPTKLTNDVNTYFKNIDFTKVSNLDELYLYKYLINNFAIKEINIPEYMLSRYKLELFEEINYQQYPDGSLFYEVVYLNEKNIKSDVKVKKVISDFIYKLISNNGLWISPYIKYPTLKETYYGIQLSTFLLKSFSEEEIKSISRFYDISYDNISKNKSQKDLPFLIGIGYWLQEKGIEKSPNNKLIEKYIREINNMGLPEKSKFIFTITQIYEDYDKDISKVMNSLNQNLKMEHEELKKSISKYTLDFLSGILISSDISKDEVGNILSYYKKSSGYSINSSGSFGDIIGNYYASSILKYYDITDPDFAEVLKKFRDDTGYNLYVKEPFTNLELSYLGFKAESNINKKLEN